MTLAVVLSGTPSHQSAAYGYTSLVEEHEVYVLTGEIPWYNFGNPGPCNVALPAH